MKGKINLILRLAAVVLLFLMTRALAENYSADVLTTTKMGTMKSKVYMAGDKVRMESEEGVIITRADKKVIWMLNPKEKFYVEVPLNSEGAIKASDRTPGEIERKFLGKEELQGILASKFMVVIENNNIRQSLYQWLAPGMDIPIKVASLDGSWSTEYKNIIKGTPPASLFEVPKDYRKFSYQMPDIKDFESRLKKE